MSKVPGIQYPAHLDESNPTDAAIKNIIDNIFYLRGAVSTSQPPSLTQTTTPAQVQKQIKDAISVYNITNSAASILSGTHAKRLATPPVINSLFIETDRASIYESISTGSGLSWILASSSMVGLLVNRPTDLGVNDIGFLFTSSDSLKNTQYIWLGTAWITVGGMIQEASDAATNTITNSLIVRHVTSGVPTTNFGLGVITQLQDSGAVTRNAAYETTQWSSAATNTAFKQWSLDSAGTLTLVMGLDAGGNLTIIGEYIWKSGTAFTGTLAHSNTGNRIYTFSDATGNIVYETAAPTVGHFVGGGGGALISDMGFAIVPIASGGTNAATAAAARASLGAAASSGVAAHTITLAKLTGGGANGSITWNSDGVVTAFVDPT